MRLNSRFEIVGEAYTFAYGEDMHQGYYAMTINDEELPEEHQFMFVQSLPLFDRDEQVPVEDIVEALKWHDAPQGHINGMLKGKHLK